MTAYDCLHKASAQLAVYRFSLPLMVDARSPGITTSCLVSAWKPSRSVISVPMDTIDWMASFVDCATMWHSSIKEYLYVERRTKSPRF